MPSLLVIGYVWPEPRSSAAGSRMMQLLHFFKKNGYEITYATTARPTENKVDLKALGISEEKIKLNDPGFDRFLIDLNPDTVLFDRFMMEEQFGWRIDEHCPEAVKILDTEDLHFLRDARHKAYKKKKHEDVFIKDSDLTKREIAAIYRSDISLIISEIEMGLLQKKFQVPRHILLYLPFMLAGIPDRQISELGSFEKRKDFISIGNFLHEPNWRAVLTLKEKIWPEIRKRLPEARMHIYGAYASQKVEDLHNPSENFLIHGWAEDSRKVMQNSRICLAPIMFGAGLKGKLVEAMQCGTPSITTPVGAEGINSSEEWNGFICEDMDDFANKAVALYTSSELWHEKQNTGFRILAERFDEKIHQKRLLDRLARIGTHLEAHRSENFTGLMLKHHLHRSTYFMSKFIEEKNRNRN